MARYLPDTKTLVQHIPRTGGTWVEHAIETCGIEYSRWLERQPLWLPRKHCLLFHQIWEDTEVENIVAFVRHPKTYYESVWKWMKASGKAKRRHMYKNDHWTWHPHAAAARQWDVDFNKWVSRMLYHEPCWCTRLFEAYVGPAGGEFCQYIGRTETLAQNFYQIFTEIGYEETVWRHQEELYRMQRYNEIAEDLVWNPDNYTSMLRLERPIIDRFYQSQNARKVAYAPKTSEAVKSCLDTRERRVETMQRRREAEAEAARLSDKSG